MSGLQAGLAVIMLNGGLTTASSIIVNRLKRQVENSTSPEGHSDQGDGSGDGGGVSLGEILGKTLRLLFLVCCIIYCIGIGYKIFKIFKGTYVEEEPVFLKYK